MALPQILQWSPCSRETSTGRRPELGVPREREPRRLQTDGQRLREGLRFNKERKIRALGEKDEKAVKRP